jgi:hypothetical protein
MNMDEQEEKVEESIDRKEIRCPKLGHQIPFRYCQKENIGLPCSRALKCWGPWPEAIDCLRGLLSRETWDRCFNNPPKPKMVTLLDLIERAKNAESRKAGSTEEDVS